MDIIDAARRVLSGDETGHLRVEVVDVGPPAPRRHEERKWGGSQ